LPTVIDELVTHLTLDPSQFTEGEAKMVESLRRMEAAAERGGRQLTETTGRSTVQFFRSIESPIASLRHYFEGMVVQSAASQESLRQVGEQGQKTGEQVSRGLGTAALAARALGVAGLAAYAAYETLHKTLQAVSGVAGNVFTTGIGAGAAGMGITEFGAISQALFTRNVPQAETQTWLAQYALTQTQAAQGIPEGVQAQRDLYTKLAMVQGLIGDTGIDPQKDTPEQMAIKLARALASATEQNAQSAGQTLGLTPTMVHGLRAEGANLPADIAAQRAKAPTPGQEDAAERLIKAENNLATAWENLYRSVMLGGLADKLTRFANWLDDLIEPAKPGDPRNWWQRHAPDWAGGQEWTGQGATGAHGIVDAAKAAGANDSATAVMLSAASVEGGLGDDSWRPNAQGSGARGRWQLLGAELKRYLAEGNREGDDAAQTRYVLNRLNEIWKQMGLPGTFSTSTDTEAQVRAITKFEGSGQGPEYYSRGLASARKFLSSLQSQSSSESGSGYRSGAEASDYEGVNVVGVPPGQSPVPTSGLPDVLTLKGKARQPEDVIRRAQARGASGAKTTHNHGDVHVGHITVHAPTREGKDIANAVTDELNRVQLANRANAGLT
jgi:hypothetical protein